MSHQDARIVEEPSKASVAIRIVHNTIDVEKLLPLTVLNRLCSSDVPSRVRQCNVYLSHVVTAVDDDAAVGFAAYKTTSGPVSVAHEFWVDPEARAGVAAVTKALLQALEGIVTQAGCSRLFVVTSATTRLRRIIESCGYNVSLAGAELIWFEKGLAGDGAPLECA